MEPCKEGSTTSVDVEAKEDEGGGEEDVEACPRGWELVEARIDGSDAVGLLLGWSISPLVHSFSSVSKSSPFFFSSGVGTTLLPATELQDDVCP